MVCDNVMHSGVNVSRSFVLSVYSVLIIVKTVCGLVHYVLNYMLCYPLQPTIIWMYTRKICWYEFHTSTTLCGTVISVQFSASLFKSTSASEMPSSSPGTLYMLQICSR